MATKLTSLDMPSGSPKISRPSASLDMPIGSPKVSRPSTSLDLPRGGTGNSRTPTSQVYQNFMLYNFFTLSRGLHTVMPLRSSKLSTCCYFSRKIYLIKKNFKPQKHRSTLTIYARVNITPADVLSSNRTFEKSN